MVSYKAYFQKWDIGFRINYKKFHKIQPNKNRSLYLFAKKLIFLQKRRLINKEHMEALYEIFGNELEKYFFSLPDNHKYALISRESKRLKVYGIFGLEFKFAPAIRNNNYLYLEVTFITTNGKRHHYKISQLEELELYDYKYLYHSDSKCHLFIPQNKEMKKMFQILIKFERIEYQSKNAFIRKIKDAFPNTITFQKSIKKKYEIKTPPKPIIEISRSTYGQRALDLKFDYKAKVEEELGNEFDNSVCRIEKKTELEDEYRKYFESDPFISKKNQRRLLFNNYTIDDSKFLLWLEREAPNYIENGFVFYSKELEKNVKPPSHQLKLETKKQNNWLNIKPIIIKEKEGEEIEISEFFENRQVIVDKKGEFHFLSKNDLDKMIKIYKYGKQKGDTFSIPSENFILINEIYDKAATEKHSYLQKVEKKFQKLKKIKKIKNYKLPESTKGELRNYQKHGYNWLMFLHNFDFNGILADDMGLGKTVQTLYLLARLKETNKHSISLLVLPVSSIPNWEREIEKFTSNLKYSRHMGQNRKVDPKMWKSNYDLILTSYATMRNDVHKLHKIDWDYIILDEAQNIKNALALSTKAVKILESKHRLALSGTPIENNIFELWSIFDFLMPGFLGDKQWFKINFAEKIQQKDKQKIEQLRNMIYPFILRRKKEDVKLDLPDKTEIDITVRMNKKQKILYHKFASRYKQEIDDKIRNYGINNISLKIFEAMLRLRQICIDPKIIDEKFNDIESTNMDAL